MGPSGTEVANPIIIPFIKISTSILFLAAIGCWNVFSDYLSASFSSSVYLFLAIIVESAIASMLPEKLKKSVEKEIEIDLKLSPINIEKKFIIKHIIYKLLNFRT